MTRRSLAVASLCGALVASALDPQLAEARHRRKKLPPPPPEALFDPVPSSAPVPPAPAPTPAATGSAAAAASAPVPAPAASAGAGASVAAPVPVPTAPALPYAPPPASVPAPSAPALGAGVSVGVGVQGPGLAPPPANLPPPPPPIPMQQIYGVPGPQGGPPLYGAPGVPPGDISMASASTSPAQAQKKRGSTLLIAGLGALGGSYLLGIAFSSFSYAGFYRGQWGYLIPIAGPIVSMSGADGGYNDMNCPGSCFPKNMYAGFTGAINLAAYLGSIGTLIAGAVTLAPSRGAKSSLAKARLLPYAGGTERGLLVVGRF